MDGSYFPDEELSELETAGAVDVVKKTCPALDLEIGMYFDGTGNNLENVTEGNEVRAVGGTPDQASYNNDLSNVAKLYLLHRDGVRPQVYNDCGGIKTLRRVEIIDGIGTTSGYDDDTMGLAVAWGPTGIETRAQEGFLSFLRFVNEAKSRGEVSSIKLDVFGFSRGAAAARHFINCMRRGNAGHGYGGPSYEIQEEDKPKIEVRFLGIFDTVVSWGTVANDSNQGLSLKIEVPDDAAKKIVEITALDEFRENFALTLMPESAELIQMPGAHSDIGGGYPEFWVDRVEIKKSEQRFSNRDKRPFPEAKVLSYPNLFPEDEILRQKLIAENWISESDTDALTCEYSPVGTNHYDPYSCRWFLTRPWLNHKLSHVALHLMHKKAVDAGVPFPSLPNDENYNVTDNTLRNLLKGLLEGKKFSKWDTLPFRRNYVHHSASWASSAGFYPNKPHEGSAHRTVYNNDGSLQKT